jgi:hypothetical protein
MSVSSDSLGKVLDAVQIDTTQAPINRSGIADFNFRYVGLTRQQWNHLMYIIGD